MNERLSLQASVDEAEVKELQTRWGEFACEAVVLDTAPPFLTGEHQLLTSDGRRAEICYVLHEGNPRDGVLLHIKTFYPESGWRLPTGGIHLGEGVEGTLAREIAEETGLQVGGLGPDGVVVERLLGLLTYDIRHSTLGRQPFATYCFLVRKAAGAPLVPQDEGEEIAGWKWIPAEQLAIVAAALNGVGERADGEQWADWGRFRAHCHAFVARMLGVPD